MSGRMDFDFRFGKPGAAGGFADREHQALRILVMGDFSGRDHRGGLESGEALAHRAPVAVDVDNFEEVLRRFEPRLDLQIGEAQISIEISALDDFHPDVLYERLDVFRALRELRGQLSDPATFAEAAAALRRDVPTEPPQPASAPAADESADAPSPESAASTFERLIGAPTGEATPAQRHAPDTARRTGVTQLIRKIVEPHIVPAADPQQDQYVASLDAAIGDQMRSVIHHPAFQALESVWRGVSWLITSVETGEALSVHLLDVTPRELATELDSADEHGSGTSLDRLLVERGVGTPGGQPWSLLVGLYLFGDDAGDARVLTRLGGIASRAGGPFVAGARPGILGCRSLAETPDPSDWPPRDPEAERRWQALRRSDAASWIGLALPRVLLRVPYGSRTESTERFEFEELLPRDDHEAYLWGNPALVCAVLIAAAFQERGWSLEPGDLLAIDDLPTHAYEDAGESKMKPCAEVLLSERAGAAILGHGLMPLLSVRNRNAVQLMRFQSVADPPVALSGPWA